jgi:hypothetical protein
MKAVLGKLSLTICGNQWTAYFLRHREYARLHGEESRAITIADHKELHFNCEKLNHKDRVGTHELVHAYADELMGHDLPLDYRLQEEFFAVLFETRGEELIKKAKPLNRQLHKYGKLMERENGEKQEDEEDYE